MLFTELTLLLYSMPAVRFAVCTQCRTCTSLRERQCRNCQASFPENCVIRRFRAPDIPEESVEAFVTCPRCERPLDLLAESCPKCGATITREYAGQSVYENVAVGEAYLTALKTDSIKPAAIISLSASVAVTACVFFFYLPA